MRSKRDYEENMNNECSVLGEEILAAPLPSAFVLRGRGDISWFLFWICCQVIIIIECTIVTSFHMYNALP